MAAKCDTLIYLYLVHSPQATPEIHTMAKFFMELCLTEYSMLRFLPSHLAAAALNLAMKAYSAGEWVSQTFNIRDNVYCLFSSMVLYHPGDTIRHCIVHCFINFL